MVAATHNSTEYTVSEIAGQVKRMVEETFGYVRVRGEISKASVNAGSGHCYLSLKDERAVLDAVCWKGTMSKLTHRPEAGMEVIATGKLTTYPGSSKYQLVIDALEPAGVGALMAMLEERKKKLAAEGLFAPERKQPLPFLPEVIGIVTSPTGAVIRDILHRLGDRFPRHVLLWPVAVQGQNAAEQVAAAIEGFNSLNGVHAARSLSASMAVSPEDAQAPPASPSIVNPEATPAARDSRGFGATQNIPRPDVIIVARGGGSIEDLWAFNEEVVVRAVAASAIPIISAVGHETDTTLIDYAADRRAPTPTGAAEMVVPVRDELRSLIETLNVRQKVSLRQMLQHQQERVEGLARGLPRPQQLVAGMAQALDGVSERLSDALPRWLARREEQLGSLSQRLSPRLALLPAERAEARLERLSAMLESLNVLAVLKRGYTLVKTADGVVVPSAAALADGMPLRLQFHDGEREAISGAGGKPAKSAARKPKPAAPQPGLFDD